MTLLAQLGEGLPERYYLGLDISYKEHVAVVISLETCVRGGERWKRALPAFSQHAGGVEQVPAVDGRGLA